MGSEAAAVNGFMCDRVYYYFLWRIAIPDKTLSQSLVEILITHWIPLIDTQAFLETLKGLHFNLSGTHHTCP